MAMEELDALEADLRSHLRAAALIDALELLWVDVALPVLVGVLYGRGHQVLATVVGFAWLLVATIHLIGVPFSCRDRQRGRVLLRHLESLHTILEHRPLVRDKLNTTLEAARTDGVLLDASALALVDRMLAEHPQSISARPA